MNRKIKNIRNRRGGFTLLEVLLVVGILALLAAFVVPNLMGAGDKAKIDATNAMVKPNGALGTALELYRNNMGKYPDELKELVEPPSDEAEKAKWGQKYINDLDSLKDAWGNDLQYKYPGQFNQDGYDLWSTGKDGQDGTDDDIKNWKTS